MWIDIFILKFAVPWIFGPRICRCSLDTTNQSSRINNQLLPTRQQLAEIVPICGLWYSSKLLTLYSFSLIPMSMTYTLKSISPLISCLLIYIFKGHIFNWRIYMSLVPICGGVILATANSFEFSHLGIALGVISVFAGVLYSMGMKELLSGSYNMKSKSTPNEGCRRLFLCIPRRTSDMVTSSSWPILAASLHREQVTQQISAGEATSRIVTSPKSPVSRPFVNKFISSTRLHLHVSSFGGAIALTLHFIQKWRALHSASSDVEFIADTEGAAISPPSAFNHVLMVLIFNGALNFGSSFFSYLTMSLTANLTWQVFNTLKRLCVIVASIMFFGTELKRMTVLGMFTGVFGVFCYNVVKSITTRKAGIRNGMHADAPVLPTIKIVWFDPLPPTLSLLINR